MATNIPKKKLIPPPIRPSPKDATPITEEAVQGPNILSDRRLNLDVENTVEEKKEDIGHEMSRFVTSQSFVIYPHHMSAQYSFRRLLLYMLN